MSTTGVMPDAAVSAALERLLPAALVGTERAPGWRAALSAAPAPLNGLMAALAATPDEDAAVLLRAAGVLALAARIGADGLALPAEADALPARPERRPALTDASSRAVVETLHEAAKHRGVTTSDGQYQDLAGKPGGWTDELQVFERDGKACRRCRSVVSKVRMANKTVYLCEACQV